MESLKQTIVDLHCLREQISKKMADATDSGTGDTTINTAGQWENFLMATLKVFGACTVDHGRELVAADQ